MDTEFSTIVLCDTWEDAVCGYHIFCDWLDNWAYGYSMPDVKKMPAAYTVIYDSCKIIFTHEKLAFLFREMGFDNEFDLVDADNFFYDSFNDIYQDWIERSSDDGDFVEHRQYQFDW